MISKEETNLPIAVILTRFEHTPPYRMLQEIDRLGIRDVYILLDNEEYEHAIKKSSIL